MASRQDEIGTPEGIRTPGLLLRRQLLYPTELLAHILERVTRIELASPAWKAGALAIVLHPRMGQLSALVVPQQQIISLPIIAHRSPFVNIFFTKFSPPRFLAEKHLHSFSK